MKVDMMLDKKAIRYIYVVLITIAFTTQLSKFTMPYYVQNIISLLIVLFTVFIAINSTAYDDRKQLCLEMIKWYLIPAVIIHLYSIIMIVFGKMDSAFLCTNITTYAPILTAISSIFLFGKDAIMLNFFGIIFAWIISFCAAILFNGIGVIPFAIQQAYFGKTTPILGVAHNYLEFHDIVLTLGCIFVYYLYYKNKLTKKDVLPLVILLGIIALGMKRISILGALCSFIFIKVIKKVSPKKKIKSIYVVGGILAFISITFIWMIYHDNVLYKLIGNINLMGRNYYYDTIKKYGKLSIAFFGTGRNSVSQILMRDYAYLHVGGVHSDILKMFIENGLIMFLVWLWYYLFQLPKMILEKLNVKTMCLYMAIIIYTFILYLTDNVENYYIYQIFFTIIPVSFYLNSKANKGCDNNEK